MRYLSAAAMWASAAYPVCRLLDDGFKAQAYLFGLVSAVLALVVLSLDRRED